MNNFGEKIKKIRKERGLTQQEFASSLGYAHKSTINKIESGQEDMSYQKILILLKEYMLSSKDLFDEVDGEIKNIDKQIDKSNFRHDSCIVYLHGLCGNAKEAEFYSFLSDKYDVIGLDYEDGNPWETKDDIIDKFARLIMGYKNVYVIGNSMGAFYAYNYLGSFDIKSALFISPFVNMKAFIELQLNKNKISMESFEQSKIIELPNKQILSFPFYKSLFEKNDWKIKTFVIYGGRDKVVDKNSIFEFISNHNACLSVMKNGEHNFHTPSQLRVLKKWISECLE